MEELGVGAVAVVYCVLDGVRAGLMLGKGIDVALGLGRCASTVSFMRFRDQVGPGTSFISGRLGKIYLKAGVDLLCGHSTRSPYR
jgi:hypothetical protein